jgi:hypothetical protein
MERKSIIKQSSAIRIALQKRFQELKLKYTAVSRDAKSYNVRGVTVELMSRYFNQSPTNGLPEEAIIFLCWRYGVPITLLIGKLKVKNGGVNTYIPDYNEKDCIEKVKKLFGEKNLDKQ